ncbi:MAG: DUF2344 domain-containing protein [Lachnospiraceae bacterium]|nr:DUF2344 domain-containing protein [Lachnospiraceae bacterium]
MKLRIKFRKYGPIRFIGHLDVMRFFQKAIRRAQLDVAYTQGFSPHQIMSFAAPLGVGLESNGEYMDIEVHSLISCEDVRNRLNAVSAPGIEIVSVKILPEEAGNAMASVAAASYTVRFREGRGPHFEVASALEAFLSTEEIWYTKESKKGSRQVDLKPGIYEICWQENAFHMLVDASSAGNIKPIQIVEALFAQQNETLLENALLVTREDTFTDIGKDGSRKLVSLDHIGICDIGKENYESKDCNQ